MLRSTTCGARVELDRREVRRYAPEDTDLDSIRDDPRYAELLA